MIILYRLSLFVYRCLVFVASGFNEKAKKAIFSRAESLTQLAKTLSEQDDEIGWFHAASLGEFEQGLPIMQAYKETYPQRKIMVTFFSPSGYEQRQHHSIVDYAAYLPWDSPQNAEKFLDLVKPKEVFFVKYEFWYFMLKAIHQKEIPLYLISARFVQDQPFFKWYGRLHRKMLTFFDQIFVQNEASADLLRKLKDVHFQVSGDTRFDNVMEKANQISVDERIGSFKDDHRLLILGSAWMEDIQVLSPFLQELPQDLKVLIAPHDISEFNIKRITSRLPSPPIHYSIETEPAQDTQFMIVDTIGQLFNAYQYGDLAFIGGAFGDGLHNILEATAFGIPVVFGNKGLHKFPEAGELIKLGGAFSIDDAKEAFEVLTNLLSNKLAHQKAQHGCVTYMESKKGATAVIMDYLRQRDGR
jgi:3-deoxy-D-manno-octulosonic-acid transferase